VIVEIARRLVDEIAVVTGAGHGIGCGRLVVDGGETAL
jgi:hypothetical protein